MDVETAKSLNLTVKHKTSNVKWISANGNEMQILGEAVVFFYIDNIRLKHRFLIVNNLVHKVILGLDFMYDKRVVLNIKRQTATIGDRIVKLNDINPDIISNVNQTNVIVNEFRPSKLVKINPDLKENEKTKINNLIDEYADIFAKDEYDIGKADFYHEIKLLDDEPVKSRPYRVPYAKEKVVEKLIKC
jgi:hypothetical protein